MLTTNPMSHVESRCDTTRDGQRPSQRPSHMESHVPRPDQTRPEVLYLSSLVCIGHPVPARHLGDGSRFRTAGTGC